MKRAFIAASIVAMLLVGCHAPSTTTSPPITYSQYQLEYRLAADFGEVFWCDPDVFPISRPGQELQNALEQFPQIRSNEAEFSAILQHLLLDSKQSYTDEEKLLIYRQHKFLTYAIQMTTEASGYQFVLLIGEGQGERIQGTVSSSGVTSVQNREQSTNTCPICLSRGTLIDTESGPVPVEAIHVGMLVWTKDSQGNRVLAPVSKVGKAAVPVGFRLVSLVLGDGRALTASPGHPSSEGVPLGEYNVGDELDGGRVVAIDLVPYSEGITYDILPAGDTGIYWANGIALESTLNMR